MSFPDGPETARARSNFALSGIPADLRLVRAIVRVKLAATAANAELGTLDTSIADAIMRAGNEVLEGAHDAQFVTDAIQGGAGTSLHMNVNEVLAARATDLLGGAPVVHPLDHVNIAQSTNDVLPTALALVVLEELPRAATALGMLADAFAERALACADVVKVGRTHLQDAVPMTLGQELAAYAAVLRRDRDRLQHPMTLLQQTNLGGTAIGTGIGASKAFIAAIHRHLATLTGIPFTPADDRVDRTQNVDGFLHVAALLQVAAVDCSKIASDLRLLASGPRAGLHEITLPERQAGSTIMPGKVNPVIPEATNQAAFQILANMHAVFLAGLHGQLELNVMFPVLAKNLLEALTLLPALADMLRTLAVDGLDADRAQCTALVERSLASATVLVPRLGYDRTAALVKTALANDESLRNTARHEHLNGELDAALDPAALTSPPETPMA